MGTDLTLGSLFDGSGGFPLGGMLSGITPVWASEIEPFAVRVTTKRLPYMKHYGDVSQLRGAELEPVDIITFGSPCQDMSIAGRRAGLDGSRSNLFYEAVRITKEMRQATNGRYPTWLCWENVPGAFSSNGGADFKAVLDEIRSIKDAEADTPRPEKWPTAGCVLADDYSIAWRVLDAQYWGVPQRRKRIFLVADLAGQRAGKVLFESEGMSGYTPQGFRSRQGTAGTAEESAHASGRICLNDQGGAFMSVSEDVSGTLRSQMDGHPPVVMDAVAVENHPTDSRVTVSEDGTVQTLTSRMGTGGNNVPLVFGICAKDSNAMKSSNPNSGFYEAETTRTLDGNGGNPTCNQGGMAVVAVQGSMIGRADKNGPQGCGYGKDISFTLDATDRHAVAYGIDRAAFNQGQNAQFNITIDEEVEPPMLAKGPGAVAHPVYSTSKASYHLKAAENVVSTLVATDYKDPPIVTDTPSYGFYPQMKAECVTFTKEKSGCLVNGTNPGFQNGVLDGEYIVRRLTPVECARLQGFPDRWCRDLETEEPTEADMAFWRGVFETYRKASGSTSKPKSDEQIKKWLKDPHSDSAEYKLWGNGVALPCVHFVLAGIAWMAEKSEKNLKK